MPFGEGARENGGDSDPICDEPGAVVHEALSLDDGHELPRHPEPSRDRGCGKRIGRRHDRSEHEGAAPRQAVDELVCDDRYADRGRDDEADGEQADRPGARAQVAQRGEEGRAVEEGRQDAEEDELGRQLEVGHPRHDPDDEPTENEQDRIRDPESRSDREHRRDRDDEPQGDQSVL